MRAPQTLLSCRLYAVRVLLQSCEAIYSHNCKSAQNLCYLRRVQVCSSEDDRTHAEAALTHGMSVLRIV